MFIEEVTRYFMNFLETDFRKRRIPKRSLSFKDRRGNLTAFRLEKYPVFQRKFTRLISRQQTDFQTEIKRGQYTATISPNLSDIVTQQALGLIENVKSELPAQFEAELVALFVKYEKDQEIFIQEAQSALNDLLNHSFVNKVMTSIEGTLQRGRESETEDATEISDELTNYLTSVVESTIFDASTSYLVDKDFNAMNDVLDNILDSKNIIARFKDFFESFSIRDMHVEIADLYRNKKLKEELELYLYLGEIKFNGRAYPLFFLPLDITEESSNNQIVYRLSFEKRFFINKNAIEYVYQESAPENTAAQIAQEIGDRIIYIGERETLTGVAERISNQLLSQFRLDGNIQFSNNFPSTASNSSISINNKCSIALFDKADESSINDYEELLRYLESGNPLGEMFKNIISNFINEEPVTISNNIQREWDGYSTSEQLVFSSPIPLNEEQRKIISAVNNEEGKFITVEGPPGTGKSHTITAILFEAILKNKSVLMLSDKKEALDVVEDKLTETLNKTRVGEDFQNPILRLGRAGNTYAKILQNQNVERIKMHLRASVDKLEDIKPEKQEKELKQKVETYISSYAAIHAKDIKQYLELVGQLSLSDGDENTLLANSTPINKLKTAITALQKSSKDIDEHTKELIAKQRKTPLQTISKLFLSLQIAQSNKTKTYTPVLSIFNTINRSHLKLLKPKIAEYMEVKDRFWAFLLSNLQLNDWNQSLNEKLDLKEFIDFREEKNFGTLQKYYGLLQKLEKAFKKNNIDAKSKKLIDDFLVDENVIIKPKLAKDIHEKIEEYEKVSNIEHLSKPPFSINFIKDQNLLDYDYDTDLSRVQLLKTFIDLSKKLKKHFKAVPDFNLSEEIKEIQNNSTVKMTNIFDNRFVNYVDHNKTHAQTLKRMISKKQKFPRDDLNRLKNAFPCIIAGIRDYAEYVPLEPEIFDLIVIDEASQVSIAQAFPAILRAKKIIVMGDKKQFSNVKATNSSKLINSNYQDGIRQAFRNTYGDDPQKLERSNIFNIRVSILEFFENIANYNCLLKKHFRGYPEIISFSSKNFYNNELQTIKVRAKPIDEVISFNDVNHDNLGEVLGNINKPESDFIVKEIEKLCELESPPSVGVITPMRDQQKFIFSELDKSEKRQAMKKLNIKVMTFDSCQGEEKDIIFYSFVDTAEKDISFRVLGSNFNLQTMDPEENLRMQRMNVGMSRAKEKIVFALSKPIDEYYGNTLKILSHYRNEVKIANRLPSPDETGSPMEAKLLNWIRQTSFYSKHSDNIEVQAQFEVGSYLKTLDPTYSHPNYRCDFLMTYTNKDEIKNLIIEYDGFLEHFVDREHVNEFNYSHYYSEKDIQREKILEGYGFPFLRINKFNLGKEPVNTLSKKLHGFFLPQQTEG